MTKMTMNDFDSARSLLVRQAFWLEWLTIGWMIIEAVVATASGIVAGSISLVAFGIDSFIKLASAGVVVWRLSVELKRGRAFSEKAERIATASPVVSCSRSPPMSWPPAYLIQANSRESANKSETEAGRSNAEM
jgi:hypothetical protein